MPSRSLSARSIGTRDSTKVQRPLVNASTSPAFIFRLPLADTDCVGVSCVGVKCRPRSRRIASRSESASMTPVCDLPTASIARYLNLPWWLAVSVDLAFTALGFLFIFAVLFILVVPFTLVVPFILVLLAIRQRASHAPLLRAWLIRRVAFLTRLGARCAYHPLSRCL